MHLLTLIWHYLAVHKDALLALFGGSAGVWAAVQTFLHTAKVQGALKSFLTSHVGALLAALANYAVTGSNDNVGTTYLLVWFASQFWHYLALNPLYNKYLVPFLTWLNAQKIATTPTVETPADTATSAELV